MLFNETFAKLHKTSIYVIPAPDKDIRGQAPAGIQYQVFSRFRVKPGMTNRGVMQMFLSMVRLHKFEYADQ